jgi:hypothetical protein
MTGRSDVGRWFVNTRAGQMKDRIGFAVAGAILLFCLWKSFF